jgi:hypothetical protein
MTLNREAARGGGKVSVGCKLPHGIELWLYEETVGPVDPVTRTAPKVFRRKAGPVVLNGTNAHKKGGKVIGGFGLTENVDADFMDAWMAQNPHFPAVENGLIILGKRSGDVRAEAKEKADIQGIERINPDHPERHNGPDTPKAVVADQYEGKKTDED